MSGRGKSSSRNRNIALTVALVAIVLILVISLLAVYFVKPEFYDSLRDKLGLGKGEEGTNVGGDDSSDIGGNDGSDTGGDSGSDTGGDNGSVAPGLSDGTLHMTVVDVGQGDCIFMVLPDGKTMLMDAGTELGKPSHESDIMQVIDAFSVTAIDYLFITHSDYDHIRYICALLEKYEFRQIYMPKVADDMSGTWTKTVAAIDSEKYTDDGGNKVSAERKYNVGSYVIEGDAWRMRCFSYSEDDYPSVKKSSSALVKNAVSPICLLEYAGRTIVLTGDSNERNEPYLLGKGYFSNIDADVLKVAHHGSKTSTCDDFLDAVDCEYAVISYGDGNSYGHPTPELMGRLEDYKDVLPDGDYDGFKYVYETAKDGNVSIFIDGDGTLRVDCESSDDKDFTDTIATVAVMSVTGDGAHMIVFDMRKRSMADAA
ncbi:MAG: MBL fold metallo-hydrolase [Clostridia bacterium]|nr:MBL fold metallo-hydrolase [Clostridia bacterium]